MIIIYNNMPCIVMKEHQKTINGSVVLEVMIKNNEETSFVEEVNGCFRKFVGELSYTDTVSKEKLKRYLYQDGGQYFIIEKLVGDHIRTNSHRLDGPALIGCLTNVKQKQYEVYCIDNEQIKFEDFEQKKKEYLAKLNKDNS